MKEDISDQELREIAERRRQDIAAYRRESKVTRVGNGLDDTLDRIRKRGKRARKGSNRRELPEKEYIPITNQFTEAMSRQYLRPNESKVLWHLLRKTWGWQKKSEFILLRQFEKELDILKPHISRALSSLTHRRIVTKLGNKRYAIQADTSLWQDKPKKSKCRKQRSPKK